MSASEAQRGSSTLEPPHPHGTANGRTFGPGRALRQGGKVLPEHARGHNRSLLLQTLFHQGAMSRADLVPRDRPDPRHDLGSHRRAHRRRLRRRDGRPRGVRSGQARDPGRPRPRGSPHRGHRPVGQRRVHRRRAHPRRRHRRTTRGAASSPTATWSARSSRSLASSSATPTPRSWASASARPASSTTTASILSAPNLRWAGFDLAGRPARAALGLPVLVANDANAAVLAEYTLRRRRRRRAARQGRPRCRLRPARLGVSPCAARTSPRARSATSPSAPTAARSACAARSAASRPGSRCPRSTARLAAASDDDAPRSASSRDAGERLGIALAPDRRRARRVGDRALRPPRTSRRTARAKRPSRPSAHGRSPSSTTASACG